MKNGRRAAGDMRNYNRRKNEISSGITGITKTN
ncbi:hypothetical protein IMSAGC003_03395 [Lachnospiraceae bacterium]|nr:hypothetical protein IMSAGC003_03395 [Lachnospiraceae bacterium]